MRITIEYESSWRNSFLDGNNNEELPAKGRNYIASNTNLRNEENFIKREVTLDTIMGILCRLIGDQRKLYQARKEEYGPYYFKGIEPSVSFSMLNDTEFEELVYLRNMKGSFDQNSFTGMIRTTDPAFSSDYSQELWSILDCDIEELGEYLINGVSHDKTIELSPLAVIDKLEQLGKLKPLPFEGKVLDVVEMLKAKFPDIDYATAANLIRPISLYCSALYVQVERLSEKSVDIQSLLTKNGNISGISKKNVTKKDFMDRYTTGRKKRIFGNPYIRKVRVKGEGEVVHSLSKACGELEIEIDVPNERAQELESMILSAGVSAFYLGKKGLAYVSRIQV